MIAVNMNMGDRVGWVSPRRVEQEGGKRRRERGADVMKKEPSSSSAPQLTAAIELTSQPAVSRPPAAVFTV